MYPRSSRFRTTVAGSHKAVARCRLCTTIQFGADPAGVELPLLDGTVRMSGSADIKAQLSITIPGDYWDTVQPYGVEVFAERGVDFGDGTTEFVPLGYFRLDDLDQDTEPNGPIVIDAPDRTAALQDNRIIFPYQVLAGTTHRVIVDYLVNGSPDGAGTFGIYQRSPVVPIDWSGAGYDPDAATVGADVVIDDSSYDFLAKLVDARDAVLRFAPTGELAVVAREPAPDAPETALITSGVNGTLIKSSRKISRGGVPNVVRAVGSDPAFLTGYRLAYITDPTSPLRWNGPFRAVTRYYASPLLHTAEQADQAARTILTRSTGLPTSLALLTVPDPALQALDKIGVLAAGVRSTQVIDEITIPLVGQSPLTILTRTTNATTADVIDNNPPDPPLPDPEDPSGGGTTDPGSGGDGGSGPGTGDPSDGTQIAIVRGWGAVIDGDQFNTAGRPSSKWGLYDGAGHAGNGRRTPNAFTVHDGMMTIHGDGNGNSGGTAFHLGDYGYRIEIRARVYNTATDGGDRYHPVLILWPDNDQWPAGAEYDYFECDEGDSGADIFMHLPNHQPYRQDHASIPVDITAWHNYACEWNPAAQTLKQWTDGVQRYDGSGRVAQAPGPMHPTIQLDNFGGDPRSANFDIAWVRIYRKPNA